MKYLEIEVDCQSANQELIMAQMEAMGYDSFWELDNGFKAYIDSSLYNENDLIALRDKESFTFQVAELKKQNWNEEWEKNFPALCIMDTLSVRAPFHPKPEGIPLDLVMQPKMAFGTGHHATTELMCIHLLEGSLSGKSLLDAGTGTGILAMLANLLGGNRIVAYDIDDWSYQNALENFDMNGIENIEMYQGDAKNLSEKLLSQGKFDVVLANINRNILIDEMHLYRVFLKQGGDLYLSGFYVEDIDLIEQAARRNELNPQSHKVKNNWVAMHVKG